MENALAQTGTPVAPASALSALPVKSRLMLGAGIAGLAAVVLALSLWGNKGDYKVLYANLSEKDGGAIIAQLSQMNIPYRHADGGNAILVPASQVHDARLKLASAGLPKGSIVGFELMDNARFGQTQFQERLTFQRGLEGEPLRLEEVCRHGELCRRIGFFGKQDPVLHIAVRCDDVEIILADDAKWPARPMSQTRCGAHTRGQVPTRLEGDDTRHGSSTRARTH